MKSSMRWLFPYLSFLLLCSCTQSPHKPHNKLTLLVSMPPYAHIIEQIAGDQFSVICVVEPGTDPHEWEPKPSDMGRLLLADAWFTVGEEFESPLQRSLQEKKPQIKIIDLQSVSPTLPSPSHPGIVDTHFWLSPKIVKLQAKHILETLSELLPTEKTAFEKNYMLLEKELDALDEFVQEKLQHSKGQALITSHDAFTYFCNDYSIVQIATEPAEGCEPLPRELTALMQGLENQDIRAVITEPQHHNCASKRIAEQLSLPLYSIDPYNTDYQDTIKGLTLKIVNE